MNIYPLNKSGWKYYDMEQMTIAELCTEFFMKDDVFLGKIHASLNMVRMIFDQIILALDLAILLNEITLKLKECFKSESIDINIESVPVDAGNGEKLFKLRHGL